MSRIYLSTGDEIEISEVSALDTSHTLETDIIIVDFKDESIREIHYVEPFKRDYDFDKLKEAYDDFNGIEDEPEYYEGDTLL